MPNLHKLNNSRADLNREFPEVIPADKVNDEPLTGDVLAANELRASTPVKRLVVLVPEQVIGEGRLAKRIWMLAASSRLDILLVGKVTDRTREMTLRRQLASLASTLYDAWFKVETRIIDENSWVDALHQVIQLGDRIVCHTEQIEACGKLRGRSLKLVLSEEFTNPVTLLSGFCEQEKPESITHWLKHVVAWGGFFIILAVFSIVEFRVDYLIKGAVGQFLLVVILIVEFGLLWFLNTITN